MAVNAPLARLIWPVTSHRQRRAEILFGQRCLRHRAHGPLSPTSHWLVGSFQGL